MNLAALAKLGLRLPIACAAFVWLPARLVMTIRGLVDVVQGTTEISGGGRSMVFSLGFLAVIAILLLVLWWQAGRMASALLPAGAARQSEGYTLAQRLGLSAIGVWLLFNALRGLQMVVFASAFTIGGGPETMLFNIVAGFILLIGWDAIGAGISGVGGRRRNPAD